MPKDQAPHKGLTIPDLEQRVASQIAQMMEQDGLRWVKRWATPRPCCNGLSGHVYRGINVLTTGLWLMCEGQQDPRFLPRSALFSRDQERVGAVRKGQKGIPIVFAGQRKVETESGDEAFVPFWKISYVWHVSQVEILRPEKLLPVSDAMPDSGAERDEAVDAFVAGTGAEIGHHGAQAFYAPAHDKIVMPPRDTFLDTPQSTATEGYYSTLLHELVHWTGAKHRLDRIKSTTKGTRDYAFEELVAEIGSVMLGIALGVQVEPREDNAAYVKGWIERITERPKALFEAASAASKAVQFMQELQPAEQVAA